MIDHVDAASNAPLRLMEIDSLGRHLAILPTTRRLRLVPLEGGREKSVAVPDPVALAFSEDGAWLVVCGYDATALYAVPSLEKRWASKEGTKAAAFSPDGTLLALTLGHGGVKLVQVADGTARSVEMDGMSTTKPQITVPSPALSFDASGEVLFAVARRTLQAIDVGTYELRGSVALPGWSHLLARSPVTSALVTGGDTYPEGIDPTVGAHPEVEHLSVIDAQTLQTTVALPLAASRIAPDAYGKTGTVQRAGFVAGRDTFVALQERADGTRLVHGWTASTGHRLFSEPVAPETRDVAVSRQGQVWLLTPARSSVWRTI